MSGGRKRRSFADIFKVAAKRVSGALAVLLLLRKRKSSSKPAVSGAPRSGRQVSAVSSTTGSSSNAKSSFSHVSSSASAIATSGLVAPPGFTMEDIIKATGNFSASNVIGEGAFGTVYKGKLGDGSLVAIKRAKKNIINQQVSSEFKNEVLTMSKIEHLHLVRLYGYLEHGDERIIVEEYVGNGTLREHLDACTGGNGLEMTERLDIAIDIAHAVAYLHTYSDPPIIHRDIKASNTLITEKLRAKVADFGFARLASEDPDATHISTQVKGSTGYLDPEYLRTYQLTEKSDVYSFGVLLVEMMTGRHPIEPKRPLKERVTIKWAMQKLKEGDAVLVMDWRLRRSPASIMALEKILKLARRCLASTKESRPSMRKCAEVLWEVRKEYWESASSPSPSALPQSANYPVRDARNHRHTSFGIEEGESYKFVSA
ncbi:calmodulin-binding receptor-like cytoplasmic kinase 1 isoform X2 [Rhodamnia argentea]|uniref:Calmodulin-binding receptor-like cytoplasmic kinase 1 isoform X2 n=1 Tax=Rhodamnia argentea TaxID=178133 RepID=A0ABM3HTU8_9MYRT|nr:calmodulin-binding receptor-like cytoplasmic kinase 1 isoform X2 [Rhodamnia argentea]